MSLSALSRSQSNPLLLPGISASELARQHARASEAGASQARPASTVNSSMGAGAQLHGATSAARLVKKKKAGRGRMMMGAFFARMVHIADQHRTLTLELLCCFLFGFAVKVFYSLSSPRLDAQRSHPAQSSLTLPASDATAAFLATLDPSLAPSPPQPQAPPAESHQQQQNSYNCLARLSAPVWVQLVGTAPSREAEDKTEYGMLTLKTCLSAICISRPELVTDPTKDYAISAVDPYESSLQPQHAPTSSSHASSSTLPSASVSGGGGQGLMEGKGMLSWNLAEKREGTTFVCGRVAKNANGRSGPRSRKRRKANNEEEEEEDDGEREDDEPEGESEDEGFNETLEVWLQLAEVSTFDAFVGGRCSNLERLFQRTSFTQTQFLTSLRSFANPAQPQPSSDRDPPPPFRRRPPPSQQQALKHPPMGDPVKKKRTRDIPTSARPPMSAAPPLASLPTDSALASLQDPQVVALLAQLLGQGTSSVPASSTAAPFALDTPQGRALLPAIRTLAKFYGIPIPEGPSDDSPASTTLEKGKGRQQDVQDDLPSSFSAPTCPLGMAAPIMESDSQMAKRSGPKRKTALKPKVKEDTFVALSTHVKGNLNPSNPDAGCSNCTRRKSTVWREGAGDDGLNATVCNACGTFYNKHGHHRTTGDRTSPAKANLSKLAQSSTNHPVASTSAPSRPLQGRLTATCESDLKKVKKRRTQKSHGGFVAPPSPSKHIGPRHRLVSPGSVFNHGFSASGSQRTAGQFLTSPGGRSPRLRASARHGAATSPVRGNGGGRGLGLASGYQSDGDERGSMDFASLFGVTQSPSPSRKHVMPSYLLTASPGTALARILNETSVDLNHFDVPMVDGTDGTHAQNHDISFYLRTSPEEKENEAPLPQDLSSLTTDGPSTSADYDNLLSSLRRDFDTRMSSTALTAPSSPPPSSPCVQPRTSSATPGQKGKAPESCGRPAPSILDSFIDGLVPAFTLNSFDGEAPASDSDAWTPASVGDQDLDRMLLQHDQHIMSEGTTGATQTFSHRRHPPIPFHLTSHLATTSDDFDFGSLPPSSPPALPSEAIPTPSEFDSGITPDEEGYLESGDDAYNSYEDPARRQEDAVAALVKSLGGAGALANLDGSGIDKVSLDRSTVTQLLQMISASNRGAQQTSPTTLTPDAYAPSPFDNLVEAKDIAPTPAQEGNDEQSELNDLYQSLFSNAQGFEAS
ncbi:hypothetical protein P7C70_g3166, partial [Phenoliferia sp. Uapishka_3]